MTQRQPLSHHTLFRIAAAPHAWHIVGTRCCAWRLGLTLHDQTTFTGTEPVCAKCYTEYAAGGIAPCALRDAVVPGYFAVLRAAWRSAGDDAPTLVPPMCPLAPTKKSA